MGARGVARRIEAGVDEVGRGPLAGPVVTAAVVLRGRMNGLADSKTLLPERRCALYAELALRVRQGRAWIALGIASAQEIDRLNIRAASLLAMRRAVARLPLVPERILIDGDALPEPLPCRAEAIVDGDAQVPCIAAASIVAKVVRDRLMARLGELHPGYGWDRNAGYATPEHLAALALLGPNGQHRRSFRPVSLLLGAGSSTPVSAVQPIGAQGQLADRRLDARRPGRIVS